MRQRAIRREGHPSRRSGERHAGFTLVEILVVLAICVGLVALVAALYRSVGRSALALRSGGQEWGAQRQLREQLLHLFVAAPAVDRSIEGRASELMMFSWHSRAARMTGKPVLAWYRYDEQSRTLVYQEEALYAWWSTPLYDLSRLKDQTRQAPSRKILTGVEALSFRYLPDDAATVQAAQWRDAWRREGVPRLIELRFSRAGRNYTLWFDTRSTDG